MDWRCIGESLFPMGCVGSCGHELIVMIPSPLLIKLKSRHCRFTMGLIVAWFSVLVMENEIMAWPANSFAFVIVIIYRGNLTVRTESVGANRNQTWVESFKRLREDSILFQENHIHWYFTQSQSSRMLHYHSVLMNSPSDPTTGTFKACVFFWMGCKRAGKKCLCCSFKSKEQTNISITIMGLNFVMVKLRWPHNVLQLSQPAVTSTRLARNTTAAARFD